MSPHITAKGKPPQVASRLIAASRWTGCLAAWALVVGLATCSLAQRPHHYFQRADMPPGAVGYGQLQRGGPLAWHVQPVHVTAPEGTRIAMAINGTFADGQMAPLAVGLLPGRVYRLKVTNIPLQPGSEVFPTIEIINRLYAPAGSVQRFPIPIQLTREELELALRGQFVIRVIYLEDPRNALPVVEDPKNQRYYEVAASQDPLEVADRLGRPMAILRIGSRVPDMDLTTGRFLFDSPPWTLLPAGDQQPTEAAPEGSPQDATRAGFARPVHTTTAQRPGVGVGVYR
jgi:hypothetical protein